MEVFFVKGRTFKRVIAFSMAVTLCGNIMTADTPGKLPVGFSIIVCSEENASAFGIDKKYLKEGNVLSVNNPDGYTSDACAIKNFFRCYEGF